MRSSGNSKQRKRIMQLLDEVESNRVARVRALCERENHKGVAVLIDQELRMLRAAGYLGSAADGGPMMRVIIAASTALRLLLSPSESRPSPSAVRMFATRVQSACAADERSSLKIASDYYLPFHGARVPSVADATGERTLRNQASRLTTGRRCLDDEDPSLIYRFIDAELSAMRQVAVTAFTSTHWPGLGLVAQTVNALMHLLHGPPLVREPRPHGEMRELQMRLCHARAAGLDDPEMARELLELGRAAAKRERLGGADKARGPLRRLIVAANSICVASGRVRDAVPTKHTRPAVRLAFIWIAEEAHARDHASAPQNKERWLKSWESELRELGSPECQVTVAGRVYRNWLGQSATNEPSRNTACEIILRALHAPGCFLERRRNVSAAIKLLTKGLTKRDKNTGRDRPDGSVPDSEYVAEAALRIVERQVFGLPQQQAKNATKFVGMRVLRGSVSS